MQRSTKKKNKHVKTEIELNFDEYDTDDINIDCCSVNIKNYNDPTTNKFKLNLLDIEITIKATKYHDIFEDYWSDIIDQKRIGSLVCQFIENINDPKKWITSENYVGDMIPQFAIPYLITLFHAKLLNGDFHYKYMD